MSGWLQVDLQQQVQGPDTNDWKEKETLHLLASNWNEKLKHGWVVAGGPTAAGARDGGPAGLSGSFLAGQ